MFTLKNKRVLITGAAGLLGNEFIKSLISANAKCYAVDIDEKKLSILKKKIKSSKLEIFRCDITNSFEVKNLYEKLDKKKVFINTIINNAANNYYPNSKISESWQDDLDVSLLGAKNVIEIFVKKMIQKREGNIINIGSDLSVIAPDQRIYKDIKNFTKPLSYSVAKHGIVGLTKYYASLLGNKNIRCNCLSPAGVFNNQHKGFKKRLENLIPLGRMAKKSEYNDVINFLCSDGSLYMTGHNLVMDGGRSII